MPRKVHYGTCRGCREHRRLMSGKDDRCRSCYNIARARPDWVPRRAPNTHRLSNIDAAMRTGTCAACGPVNIIRTSDHNRQVDWRCGPYRADYKRGARARKARQAVAEPTVEALRAATTHLRTLVPANLAKEADLDLIPPGDGAVPAAYLLGIQRALDTVTALFTSPQPST